MEDERKPIGKDATGYEVLTQAVRALLNQFPGLPDGYIVRFEELLPSGESIAFSADNGALVYSEKKDILDVIHQECNYPFYIVYRMDSTKERQKLSVQQFLDQFGKWLCREPVEIDGVIQKLKSWPKLTGGRTITRITRDNSFGLEPQNTGAQDWILPLSVSYTNEFEL